MRFTKHALDKMQLLELSEAEILKGIEYPELTCVDTEKHSTIYIFRKSGKLYSIVVKEGAVTELMRKDYLQEGGADDGTAIRYKA